MQRTWLALSAASVIALGASLTPAAIVPNLVGSPTPTTGGFLWTYQAVAQPNSLVAANDYFTLYDFLGYDSTNPNASISAPTYWIATSNFLTPPPPNFVPPDSASISNITFQYTGLTTTGVLGNFTIFSLYSNVSPLPGFYTGQDHDADGQILQFGSTDPTPGVPEPTSLAACGLAALPLLRRRRAH